MIWSKGYEFCVYACETTSKVTNSVLMTDDLGLKVTNLVLMIDDLG